jgi:uncharacterized membrane protein YcaP (DUF421 family)
MCSAKTCQAVKPCSSQVAYVFSNIFEGTPTLLVHKGKVIVKNLMKERMRESELHTLLRKQGIHQISDIETAILEADGTLSVMKSSEAVVPMHTRTEQCQKEAPSNE